MELIYCFANASLTQRVLIYLLAKVRGLLDCVTVIFLNDRWVIRIRLTSSVEAERREDCRAFLNENGLPFCPPYAVALALKSLDGGSSPTTVMNRRHVVIVSHGAPRPEEIRYFQERFVSGLGYRPQSLV
ncbi:MAG: hypothetical protein QNJ46_15875 [Leptolyngbyaceae cyanobacterium MO_188.B28]|nr:hypothetical protein [Leptolyngbyaceae cyanobacterium MO_188.B28]